MPRLRDLEAQLVRIAQEDGRTVYRHVDMVNDAQGVSFLCPACYATNGGKRGTHSVICWFADRGVPEDERPLPGRWVPSGTTIDDLTFIGPAAASVLLQHAPCAWHGFVRNGEAA